MRTRCGIASGRTTESNFVVDGASAIGWGWTIAVDRLAILARFDSAESTKRTSNIGTNQACCDFVVRRTALDGMQVHSFEHSRSVGGASSRR